MAEVYSEGQKDPIMLLDSNIIIYIAKPEYHKLRAYILKQEHLYTSVVCKIEVLGYHNLDSSHKLFLVNFFDRLNVLPLSFDISEKAIEIRQAINISLADSIVAASAIIHRENLLSKNTKDFRKITGLNLVDTLRLFK